MALENLFGILTTRVLKFSSKKYSQLFAMSKVSEHLKKNSYEIFMRFFAIEYNVMRDECLLNEFRLL